jgi:hypothetical protein
MQWTTGVHRYCNLQWAVSMCLAQIIEFNVSCPITAFKVGGVNHCRPLVYISDKRCLWHTETLMPRLKIIYQNSFIAM